LLFLYINVEIKIRKKIRIIGEKKRMKFKKYTALCILFLCILFIGNISTFAKGKEEIEKEQKNRSRCIKFRRKT
jgi:hypothetical protein